MKHEQPAGPGHRIMTVKRIMYCTVNYEEVKHSLIPDNCLWTWLATFEQ